MATVHPLIVEIYDDVRQRTCPGSSVGGRRKSQRLPRDGVSLSSRLSVQLLLTRQRIPFQTCVELLIPSNRRLWVFQHEFFQQRWESLKGIVLASFVRGISVISYLMKMLGCINIDKIIWKLFFLILNKLSKNIIISFMDTCISYLFCCRSTSWKNNYFQPFLLMLFLCAKVASS